MHVNFQSSISPKQQESGEQGKYRKKLNKQWYIHTTGVTPEKETAVYLLHMTPRRKHEN